MGEDHTSEKMYSSGPEEEIEEFVDGKRWLLLIMHSEQDNYLFEEVMGREN